ncbi:MAG: hypothetical protein AB1454_02800 [Candidatus Auribacterota bacterium]
MSRKLSQIDVVNSWRPPDPLKLVRTDSSFSYRWMRKNEVELRKQQGWEVVDKKEIGFEADQRVSRGSSSIAECNELVLCKRPREMSEAHRSFLDNKNKRIMEALGAQFHQEGRRSGCNTYGDVTIEQKNS